MQCNNICVGSGCETIFGILENIDITGETRTLAVESDAARNITIRTTLHCQYQQYVGLQSSEGHDKSLQSVRQDAVPAYLHAS